ncbi:MAG: NAD-dependent epimerase/dehydratase family protein [Methanomassiliicoccales archaeon]
MTFEDKILITGAAGQIGSELIMVLVKRFGKDKVVATDIRSREDGEIEWHELDVTNYAAVQRMIKEEGVGTVMHLAAILSAKGEENPELAYRVNVTGTKNVLDACVSGCVEKVFIPSTIAVYGPGTPVENVPLHTPTRPITMYGITKLHGELLGEYYSKKYGLDVRGIRYPGLISWKAPPGGGTTDYAVEMIRSAVAGRKYLCFIAPSTRLPMMYMPDALDAIFQLMNAPASKLRIRTGYNIQAFSFSPSELEKELKRHFPEFDVEYMPDERDEVARSWPHSVDPSAASEDWGFHSSYNVESMISDMIMHLSNNTLVRPPGK